MPVIMLSFYNRNDENIETFDYNTAFCRCLRHKPFMVKPIYGLPELTIVFGKLILLPYQPTMAA